MIGAGGLGNFICFKTNKARRSSYAINKQRYNKETSRSLKFTR